MVKRDWGRIVFISSESGLNIPVEKIHYGMTKTAQLAIARGLAESVAGTGLTVNAVLPGPTRSDGVVEFFARLAKERGLSAQEMERDFVAKKCPTSLIRSPRERREGRQYGVVCLLATGLPYHGAAVARGTFLPSVGLRLRGALARGAAAGCRRG